MRVLITGASGLVGTALGAALRDRGDSVIGVSRQPGRRAAGPIRWIGWDDLAAGSRRRTRQCTWLGRTSRGSAGRRGASRCCVRVGSKRPSGWSRRLTPPARARRAGLRVGGGLLRPTRERGARRGHAARLRFPRDPLPRLGSSGGSGRLPRGAGPVRRRAVPPWRRAPAHAAALQAGPRRPNRARPAMVLVGPHRRRGGRAASCHRRRARRRAAQRDRAGSPSRTRTSVARWGGRCVGPRSLPCRPSC